MDGEKKLSELKHLSFKEKLQYGWDYYRWVLVVIVIVAFAVAGISDIRRNMKRTTVLSIAVPDIMQDDTQEDLQATFSEYIGGISEGEYIDITLLPLMLAQEDSFNAQITMKLTTIMAAGELDILVTNQVNYDSYSTQGAFYSMEELLETEVFAWYADRITPEGDALIIMESDIPKDWIVPEGESLYLSVLANSRRMDMTKCFVESVLESWGQEL